MIRIRKEANSRKLGNTCWVPTTSQNCVLHSVILLLLWGVVSWMVLAPRGHVTVSGGISGHYTEGVLLVASGCRSRTLLNIPVGGCTKTNSPTAETFWDSHITYNPHITTSHPLCIWTYRHVFRFSCSMRTNHTVLHVHLEVRSTSEPTYLPVFEVEGPTRC